MADPLSRLILHAKQPLPPGSSCMRQDCGLTYQRRRAMIRCPGNPGKKSADSKRGDNMTNLTSPAASTVLGSPKSNNMADVIDALKRLERIGSENSKTTEKLLAAAAELGKKIVAQYEIGRASCRER